MLEEAMRPMTFRAATVAAILAAGILASLVTTPQVHAQAWPQRAVRFIIPFGPGAGADIGARLIQEKLSTRWGKPVVIENRPGGDSMIAIQAVLAANDDHTFLWSPAGNFTVHPHLYDKLPYNPDDIVPIARYSSTILAVGVPASMNVVNLADIVKRAKAEPGKFNSAAVPGITEFAFDNFAKAAGLAFVKVPYRDIVQGANDLAEARLHIYAASYAIIRPHVEGGRVKALAVMGNKRAPSLPDLPTAAEEGFPSLEMEGLVGLFGSPVVSAELRERLGADIVAVANDKTIEDRLNATAQTPNRGGAKEFAEDIARQRAQIATIAKALGTKPGR
jgi:tripartite-type tricarboxylate transporter receptor subunit TctC